MATFRETVRTADLGVRTEIVFGRLDAFPNPDRAGVLWLGVDEGAADLATIQSRVEVAAHRAGFPARSHMFTPHVTLSRSEQPVDVRELAKQVPTLPERMIVDAVVLFRTHPGRSHGHYSVGHAGWQR